MLLIQSLCTSPPEKLLLAFPSYNSLTPYTKWNTEKLLCKVILVAFSFIEIVCVWFCYLPASTKGGWWTTSTVTCWESTIIVMTFAKPSAITVDIDIEANKIIALRTSTRTLISSVWCTYRREVPTKKSIHQLNVPWIQGHEFHSKWYLH